MQSHDEVRQILESMIGKVVVFTAKVEETEVDYDPKQKAVLTNVKDLGDHFRLTFNNERFEEYNKRYATANYFDKDDVPCLTAVEAGMMKTVYQTYLGSSEIGVMALSSEDNMPLLDALDVVYLMAEGQDLTPGQAAAIAALKNEFGRT